MANTYNRLAVDTSEDFADGLVSRRELKTIRRTVWEALSDAECKAAWEAAGVRAWEAAVATHNDRSERSPPEAHPSFEISP
jgi:hypothetical protein